MNGSELQETLPRAAAQQLAQVLASMPVAVVMGARQTGKSTLARMIGASEEREYVTLDDYELLAQAREYPRDLVARAQRLTIDEVQRAPDLLLAVKRAVDMDRPRESGRFLLTGSANLLVQGSVSETLAGRAGYVTLWPMTRREQLHAGTTGIWSDLLDHPVGDWNELVRQQDVPTEDWTRLALRGGFPTPSIEMEDEKQQSVWFDGYVQTYLERDLQALASIDNLIDFRRLMRAAFLRIGVVLNQAELARDTGLARPTAHRYLNLLEASYQLVRVEPYSVNRTKRLVKSPKLYAGDTGLASHLTGSAPSGQYLENIVLCDLLSWKSSMRQVAQILYWRTVDGAEVDFVIEDGHRLLPIEVKASANPVPADARHLKTFIDQYPEKVDGALLLHAGENTFWIAERILAAPWWRVI